MKIRELLEKNIEKLKKQPVSDFVPKARILLAHTLGVEKEYLLIHSEKEMETTVVDQYEASIKKLIAGKPLQYITNHQEFMKLNFYVDENVLIPRSDTEILVEEVINYCKKDCHQKYSILDLCTGSGAIGVSLGKYIKNAHVVCSDISEKALQIAKKNAKTNQVNNIEFIQSDLFENIYHQFDIIVSNPPYIQKDIIPFLMKEVQEEPHIALDGGKDGLDFYKKIIKSASNYLKPQGGLFLEIGYDQKEAVRNLLQKEGIYLEIHSKKDLCGNDRMVVAML